MRFFFFLIKFKIVQAEICYFRGFAFDLITSKTEAFENGPESLLAVSQAKLVDTVF